MEKIKVSDLRIIAGKMRVQIPKRCLKKKIIEALMNRAVEIVQYHLVKDVANLVMEFTAGDFNTPKKKEIKSRKKKDHQGFGCIIV